MYLNACVKIRLDANILHGIVGFVASVPGSPLSLAQQFLA